MAGSGPFDTALRHSVCRFTSSFSGMVVSRDSPRNDSTQDGTPQMAIEDYVSAARNEAKANAKDAAQVFTFPVDVRDKGKKSTAHGSCFALYSYQDGHLVTSRAVVDPEVCAQNGYQIFVKIQQTWLSCEAVRPEDAADSHGERYNLAVLKLVGDELAPAGEVLGPVIEPLEAFVAGFSPDNGEAEELKIAEGTTRILKHFEFEITAPFNDSSMGGPVLDAFGHVIGVKTGEKDGVTLATMAQYLSYYTEALGLPMPIHTGAHSSSV